MTVRMTSLALVAILALGAGACASKQDSTGSLGSAPTPTVSGGTTATGGATTAPSSPAPILPDGRSAVYLTKMDVGKRTVTFDLIDFLTGDAAKKAWKKAYPDDSDDGPPNDYFIVNDNPKLRTLPAMDSLVLKVVDQDNQDGSANKAVDFADAPAYFKSIKPDTSDHRIAWNPFWITVKGGQIIKMEEQFLP